MKLKLRLTKDEIHVLIVLVRAEITLKSLTGVIIREQQVKTHSRLCSAYVYADKKSKIITFNATEMLLFQNIINRINIKLDAYSEVLVRKMINIIDKQEKSL